MLITPLFLPTLKIVYFAPFLIFTFYRTSKKNSIWLALLCGLILDLFSGQMRFGIYAMNYTISTYVLYNLKNYFFEDSLTTLPIMTVIFVYVSALIQLILLDALTIQPVASWNWLTTELIKTPFYNILYAILAFALLPYLFPHKLKKAPTLVKFKEKI